MYTDILLHTIAKYTNINIFHFFNLMFEIYANINIAMMLTFVHARIVWQKDGQCLVTFDTSLKHKQNIILRELIIPIGLQMLQEWNIVNELQRADTCMQEAQRKQEYLSVLCHAWNHTFCFLSWSHENC